MKRFFSGIKRKGYILTWEPRGRWLEKDIESLCKELDLIHVVDPFFSKKVYGDVSYYRLHGKEGYRYKYTKDDLERMKGLAEGECDIYFMFNNVYMFDDAFVFRRLMKS